jgi:hypothetical protein
LRSGTPRSKTNKTRTTGGPRRPLLRRKAAFRAGLAAPALAVAGALAAAPQALAAPAVSHPASSAAQPVTARLDAARSGGSAVTCAASQGMVPANDTAIVSFLVAHGYTGIAAAGIAGNIFQESGGNPESVGSGGGGLIGFTPLPSGYVTGNPAADLQTQLSAILAYNQQWSQFIPALNAAATPAAAADIYMNDFERPGIPAAANREAAAEAVAAACGL